MNKKTILLLVIFLLTLNMGCKKNEKTDAELREEVIKEMELEEKLKTKEEKNVIKEKKVEEETKNDENIVDKKSTESEPLNNNLNEKDSNETHELSIKMTYEEIKEALGDPKKEEKVNDPYLGGELITLKYSGIDISFIKTEEDKIEGLKIYSVGIFSDNYSFGFPAKVGDGLLSAINECEKEYITISSNVNEDEKILNSFWLDRKDEEFNEVNFFLKPKNKRIYNSKVGIDESEVIESIFIYTESF